MTIKFSHDKVLDCSSLFLKQLKSFQLEISIASVHHPKIIGRKGQVVQKIRLNHDVLIQFPAMDVPAPEADKIVLTGYEHNCLAAKESILKIVKELVGHLCSCL